MASVLIVDDDEDIRFIYSKTLSSKGYVVFSAESGSHGLEIYVNKRPDLVIMDSKLSDMNGIEVTRRIIGIDQDAKVLGATGYSDLDEAFIEAGAARVLLKPFTMANLLEVVSEMLGDHHCHR
ncbi:MAG: response regulator [Candidatus Methanofastidiosa archaeon]|nr:response regulator [Candidatus Methanofastidiosa archaeon]